MKMRAKLLLPSVVLHHNLMAKYYSCVLIQVALPLFLSFIIILYNNFDYFLYSLVASEYSDHSKCKIAICVCKQQRNIFLLCVSQVADIKRANNLLTEQDFFALRSVKIPVRRFSVLTETHSTAPLKSASPSGARRLPQISPVTSLPSESSTDSSSSTDSVEGFLLEKDKDIERLVKSTGPSRSSLNEVVSSLTLQQQQPLLGEVEYKPVQRKDPYYGADWGMRWWTAVAIMLVVGIVTPVFYLLYYEVLMKADVSHHGTPTQAQGDMHHGHHHHGKNADFHVVDDNHAGAGHHAGNVDNGDPQGHGVDKAVDGEHGAHEKT